MILFNIWDLNKSNSCFIIYCVVDDDDDHNNNNGQPHVV